SATTGAEAGLIGFLAASESEIGYRGLIENAARSQSRRLLLVDVAREQRVGREVVERGRVAHHRTIRLRLVVSIIVPGIVALAQREVVDESRADRIPDPNSGTVPGVWVFVGPRHPIALGILQRDVAAGI